MGIVKVEDVRYYKKRGYVLVDSLVGNRSITAHMKSAYSFPNLYYIGDSKHAFRLWKRFGINEFHPIGDEEDFDVSNISSTEAAKSSLIYGDKIAQHLKNKTCSVGFSPSENKWYGWSHRAIYGFTIGSEIKKGSVAFKPSTREEELEDFLSFWDFDKDGNWTPYEGWEKDNVLYKKIIKLEENVKDANSNDIGIYLECETFVKDDRGSFISKHFHPYLTYGGKGEWTAKTLEDAKQMAIDFADGVS